MTEAQQHFPKRPVTCELRSGERVIGLLVEVSVDQPWIWCDFTPGPAWEEVSWVFSGMKGELAAQFPGRSREAMTAYRGLGLLLHPLSKGDVIKPAIVWIEGSSARYRY